MQSDKVLTQLLYTSLFILVLRKINPILSSPYVLLAHPVLQSGREWIMTHKDGATNMRLITIMFYCMLHSLDVSLYVGKILLLGYSCLAIHWHVVNTPMTRASRVISSSYECPSQYLWGKNISYRTVTLFQL